MTSELRQVLDFIYVFILLFFGHIQRPVSGLASGHELEKHDKVAWGGLTKPLLGSLPFFRGLL